MFETSPELTYATVTLGCKVNHAESDTLARALEASGMIRADLEASDVVFVNTCTVTGEADKKARKAVRHALAVNPVARVIVTGCAVAIDADQFASMDPRVEAIDRTKLLLTCTKDASIEDLVRVGDGYRTRVNIKVQDGCDHACTYCIVHTARGKARSKPAHDVLAEAEAHFLHGAKEIILTGIDIGAYHDGSSDLETLARQLLDCASRHDVNGIKPRIRISSIEPLSISDGLLDLLAESDGSLCRHLHLPLQSGSNRILDDMARPYSAEKYLEIVTALRNAVPSLSLTTDIIVGFPGETENDFEETLAMARACAFSKIHVFPYSMRKGTPAAARTDQVEAEVKSSRASELRKLSDKLRTQDRESRRGTREFAIVQGSKAMTESYHEVAAPEGSAPGDLVEVLL
ncbi:MAG: MiaB/RimO family radical SAM methylthiotransferase [Eggerthellaceae bacterium]|nr:MiaB/RimO family radical SAM methylthiotransferase [Eggerthellaceae bacterium]